MATTYTTFLDHVKTKKEWLLTPYHKIVKVPVNFATQSLDVSASDVHQVITIPANSLVRAWPVVKTAGTAASVVDLGYGGDVDIWGNAIALDNTGTNVVLLGSTTWDAGSLESGETAAKDITVDGAALGDHVTATMGVDVVDLAISAQVTAANTVTVTLSNTNDTIIDGSTTWDAGSIPDFTAAAGVAMEAKDITVTGAALGDYVIVSPSIDITDLTLTASVTATNTVTAVLANLTDNAVDLGSMTIKARVIHPAAAKDLASTTVQVKVDKAPYAGQWKHFTTTDTIDLTGTANASDTDPVSGIIEVWAEIISLSGAF